MRRAVLTTLVLVSCATRALARDPGPVETRGRDADAPRNAGVVVDRPLLLPSRVVGPPAPLRSRDQRPLYERVEQDIDRGTGRIEDEQTYQLRRLQTDRDERLGRIPPRREFE